MCLPLFLKCNKGFMSILLYSLFLSDPIGMSKSLVAPDQDKIIKLKWQNILAPIKIYLWAFSCFFVFCLVSWEENDQQ